MKRKRNTSSRDEHKVASPTLLSAFLNRSGAGKHQQRKEQDNKRKGRLKGAEKRRFRDGDYD